MKILLAPAANKIDDNHGSGSSKLFEFTKELATRVEEVHAIVAKQDIRGDLPPNLYVYALQQNWKTNNTFLALIFRLFFIFQVYFKGRQIMDRVDIDVIHHLARVPVSGHGSFNLLAILGTFGKPFFIGPIQPPQDPVDFNEVDEWLKTKKNIFNSLGMFVLKLSIPFLDNLKQITFKKASGVACINERAAEIVKRYVSEKKVWITYSGIDANKFRPVYPSDNEAKVIFLYVGYFLPRKGLEYLVRAMKLVLEKYPESELILVGNGPCERPLREFVHGLDLENNVHFTGRVSHDQVNEYYEKADVFVNPTLHEAYSNVNLEAMASGKALITTHGTNVSSNADENCALLVDPADSEQLAGAMLQLARNSKLRYDLARKGRIRVETKYSWNNILENILEMYRIKQS